MLFHGNTGYANAPQCYVYSCMARLVIFVKPENDWQFLLLVQAGNHSLAVLTESHRLTLLTVLARFYIPDGPPNLLQFKLFFETLIISHNLRNSVDRGLTPECNLSHNRK